ncbi:hypothetical protein V1503_23185 [Bacillus sp. SCS-151]|uniref:hypothetical protein n=1 Tax=Nanhaiella sioensis TaxID=3115293 RepID=UPI00397CCAD0
MSLHWYNMCRRYHGQVVQIDDHHGNRHVGRIVHLTPNKVYLQPAGPPSRGFGYGPRGGFGYGLYRPFGGFFPGLAVGIGLGAITGIALASLFFW